MDGCVVSQDKAVKRGRAPVSICKNGPSVPPVTKPVTFLLAARLLREKGICEYVEAARTIKARYPEVRFILLGGLDTNPGGISRDEIRAWVEEGVVEWPGHVPVKPWFAQASVYVLPSLPGRRAPQHARGDGHGASCHHHRRAGMSGDGRARRQRLSRTAS